VGARSIRGLKRAVLFIGIAALVGGACEMTGFAASTELHSQGNSNKAKPGQAKAKPEKANKGKDTVVVVDRDGHRRIVREYVTRGNLPPGLAKRRQLPPGLAAQLRENGALPPGLREYFIVVPADWNGRLQPLPPYYSRYFVGRDLVVIDTRSDLIVSLIRDLLD
jgi:hypothetical protein